MTNTPRADKLGELYDQACELLEKSLERPDLEEANLLHPTLIEILQSQIEYSKWVIDRYLAQQERDRQYELQAAEIHSHDLFDEGKAVMCKYCDFAGTIVQ